MERFLQIKIKLGGEPTGDLLCVTEIFFVDTGEPLFGKPVNETNILIQLQITVTCMTNDVMF